MMKLSHLLLSGALLSLAATGCSKKSDANPSPQPRDYQVEYRVTSTTDATSDYVSYRNETGGIITLGSTALPFTVPSFKRNMKLGDAASIIATLPNPTATTRITAAILLDGKVVKQETGNESANIVYVIGE